MPLKTGALGAAAHPREEVPRRRPKGLKQDKLSADAAGRGVSTSVTSQMQSPCQSSR